MLEEGKGKKRREGKYTRYNKRDYISVSLLLRWNRRNNWGGEIPVNNKGMIGIIVAVRVLRYGKEGSGSNPEQRHSGFMVTLCLVNKNSDRPILL